MEHGIDLIVIDPLTSIMPGIDRNAEGDTRDALTPLVKLAERCNVAIIGIAHVGKPNGTARRAAQRSLGLLPSMRSPEWSGWLPLWMTSIWHLGSSRRIWP